MKNTEKDRLIRALMTVVAPFAENVMEGRDGALVVLPYENSDEDFRNAYAVYWMARAMGYRADTLNRGDRGLASLGPDTCEAQRETDDDR